MKCADKCFKDMRNDDLSRQESHCLHNCFHKHYRYLAHANTVYSFLVSGGKLDQFTGGEGSAEGMGETPLEL